MNPYDEEKLRNEVIFLHNLWHQGPPHPLPPPPPLLPFPSPSQPYTPQHYYLHPLRLHHHPAPAHTRSLLPVPTTTFKKKNKNNRHNAANPKPNWAVPESPVWAKTTSATTWAEPKPKPTPPPKTSPHEKEKLAAIQAQDKACRALKEYLLSNHDDDNVGSDDNDDDCIDDDHDDEFEDFFVRVFLEDNELRGYYQRSYESGEFHCLVCNAIGKKNSGKKYKDCATLVQHSRSIMRTAKKSVHRGFGRAVCKVLGWDVNRLPTIVMNGKPLGLDVKQAQAEVESKVNNVANDDDKVMSLEHGDVAVEEPVQGVDQGSKHDRAAKPDPSWAGPEWPSAVWPNTSPTTNWAVPKPSSAPPPEVSPLKKEKLAVMQAQNKACRALKEYLSSNHDDDGDGSEDDGPDDDDDSEEFEDFFVRIFLEDHELRRYYQRSYESGEFSCLVCNAIGKKNSGKKYKDCTALVQHSMSILKTAKKWVHRGFGHAVCKVLGWDVNRLPTIIMNGTPLGLGMNSAQAEGESKANNVANDDDKVVSLEYGDVTVEEPAQGADQSINKCSSNEGDHDEKMLNIGLPNGGGGAISEGESKANNVANDDDKVVSLEHGDVTDEEPAQGADQSIKKCSSNEGDDDEKMLNIGLPNGGGGAIYEGEPKKPTDSHIDNSNVLQDNLAK